MKDLITAQARDKKTSCSENSMITNTQFLDLKQRQDVLSLEKENNREVKTYYYGGFDDAERVCVIFVPSFFEFDDLNEFFAENKDENPLTAIKITKDKFSTLTHRDYLGSLMGLGIKREMIGDIIVSDKGCYIICMKSIIKFIMQNLEKIGRGTAKMMEVDLTEISQTNVNIEELFLSVSSLRLDNIIGTVFNLSRNSASEKIVGGIVYVNGEQKLKNDFKVSVKDKIVLRGKGKAVLHEIVGESRKGKIQLLIHRYM
ncbi:MAG: YlmH/Sll1252 family protein [Clostridia bacterium]